MKVSTRRSGIDSNASATMAWSEWASLMGYAGLVAVSVSCLLGAAVVLLGT
jgi:hypothetical protein